MPGTRTQCVHLPSETENRSGEITMPTSKEYRQRAAECVELTSEANEWYVNTALLELAAVFRIRAEKLERFERTRRITWCSLGKAIVARGRRPNLLWS